MMDYYLNFLMLRKNFLFHKFHLTKLMPNLDGFEILVQMAHLDGAVIECSTFVFELVNLHSTNLK